MNTFFVIPAKAGIHVRHKMDSRLRLAGMTLVLCLLPLVFGHSVEPSRLFFSDAKVSFRIPNNWQLEPKFPYGPLFTKRSNDGTTAVISCAISAPINQNRISADVSYDILKQLAKRELEIRQPGYRSVSERERQLAGQNAFELVWESQADRKRRHQTLYFFLEDRIYAFSLQSSARTFKWTHPDFQNWLNSIRVLRRVNAGTVDTPAHGGLWIHQTAGLKVAIPDAWLVAVADDRSLGITVAEGNLQAAMTITVDVGSSTAQGFSSADKKDATKAIRRKGLRIVGESEEPFHGLPAFEVRYEGESKDRVVKGRDIWVLGPKARWLFNLEGDVSLYNSLSDAYKHILDLMEFI